MKKAYTKPLIAMESFQLNAAIAASCSSEGGIAINYGENTCTLEAEMPGLGFFGIACEINVVSPGSDDNDGFCYHGAMPGFTFISS